MSGRVGLNAFKLFVFYQKCTYDSIWKKNLESASRALKTAYDFGSEMAHLPKPGILLEKPLI